MGEALLAVVVRDPDAARRALESLRSSKTAGGVIALGIASAGATTPLGIGEPVRDHVRAHAHGHEQQIETLLDTLVVRTVLVPALALTLGETFWWPRKVSA